MDTVLVGVDGSQTSKRALRWAAHEAAVHGAELVVVLVAEPPYLYGSELPYGEDSGQTRRDAEVELQAIVDDALGESRDLELGTRVEMGDPRRVLRELSADADLLVVGSRGHGEIAGLVLGSVSQYLATHAPCSVTVVRTT